MLSVCESIQYYSGGGRQGLFSGYESRDKQETGSIYAKEGHAGIFSPPEENYYQNASKELDIYGLGKTFQYILASSETEPHLNRWEEHRLQSIISKTMGTKGSYYQSVSEIQKQIPKWKEKVNKESSGRQGKRRWKIYIALFFAVVAGKGTC